MVSEDRHDARLHAPSVPRRDNITVTGAVVRGHMINSSSRPRKTPVGGAIRSCRTTATSICPTAIRTSAIRLTAGDDGVGTNDTSPTPTPTPVRSRSVARASHRVVAPYSTRWIRRVRLTLATAITPDAIHGPADWAFGARSIRSAVPGGPLGRTVGSSRTLRGSRPTRRVWMTDTVADVPGRLLR